MKTLTRQDLAALAAQPAAAPAECIRVQLDTGGIAAGAETLFTALDHARLEQRLPFALQRTGSTGYAFADPVVEVQTVGLPRVYYGHMAPELAPQLIESHFTHRRLLDDHVIATRRRSLVLDAPVTHILVRDTGNGPGSKTEFFQFSFQE